MLIRHTNRQPSNHRVQLKKSSSTVFYLHTRKHHRFGFLYKLLLFYKLGHTTQQFSNCVRLIYIYYCVKHDKTLSKDIDRASERGKSSTKRKSN